MSSNIIGVVGATHPDTLDLCKRFNQVDDSRDSWTFHYSTSDEAIDAYERGEIGVIMKGDLHSSDFMAPIVRRLRPTPKSVLSHVYRLETKPYRVTYVTDAALNIAPTFDQKKEIVRNAVALWNLMENRKPVPRVAMLSATEEVTQKIPSTLDAEKMRHYWLGPCNVAGPLAFDNAWSLQAAEKKGIDHPVAGKADILVVPNLVAGNMMAKAMIYVGGAVAEGLVVGAKCPIVLTSRADSLASKLSSLFWALEYNDALSSGEEQ
jgi:phosphotransacetylase